MNMGIIRVGPPEGLMLQLKERYNVDDFIETGTYYGRTAVWAAAHFENVITIECSKRIYDETYSRHGNIENVDFVFGDSRVLLKTILPAITGPAIFWLDSHWSRGETYGENDECPVINEINEISRSRYNHFIFIDDARLFTSPPPRPHQLEQWPTVAEVIEALRSIDVNNYILIIEDVIISVPKAAKDYVASYCQEINTQAWDVYGKNHNKSSVKQGCELIAQGLGLVGRDLLVRLRRATSKSVRSEMFK
jgi:hypothetical protein